MKSPIYHADNGRFSEQPFRSTIENANQNIIIFGVGYNHQDDFVENNSNSNTRNLNIDSTCQNILAKDNNYNVMDLYIEGLLRAIESTQGIW